MNSVGGVKSGRFEEIERPTGDRGGTSCIPGPFGAGKTVLQHLLAKHSAVDLVILVAYGERVGEVVETITQFPRLSDPRSSGSLMDRTIRVAISSSYHQDRCPGVKSIAVGGSRF